MKGKGAGGGRSDPFRSPNIYGESASGVVAQRVRLYVAPSLLPTTTGHEKKEPEL